jgi:hypothetical protein
VPSRGAGAAVDDATMALVGRLTRLEGLWLNSSAITDAGLAHIKGLTRLRDLSVGHSGVTDAGLKHLKGLTELRGLYLAGSKVTDAGVLELEEALPGLQVLRDEDTAVYPNTSRATDDLDFARSRPVRLACPLLVQRARAMRARSDTAGFAATVNALCDLEADDVYSLVKLAEARSECLGQLDPSASPRLTATERAALQKRCADRGIAALAKAVERGYANLGRLEGDMRDGMRLWNLRSLPGYAKIVETVRAKRAGR